MCSSLPVLCQQADVQAMRYDLAATPGMSIRPFLQEHWDAEKVSRAVSENAQIIADPFPETGKDARPVIDVLYREGSNGGKSGAIFYATHGFKPDTTHAYLSYNVCFEPGFEWSRGGKLPGLYGGSAPTGGSDDVENGFTTRLMWRSEGAGGLYPYWPGKKNVFGDNVGQGSWHFTPGQWHRLEQELKLNTPGKNDGYVRIWADGQLVINDEQRVIRVKPDVHVDGVLFSTFFGGRDWHSPKDQHAYFTDFNVCTR